MAQGELFLQLRWNPATHWSFAHNVQEGTFSAVILELHPLCQPETRRKRARPFSTVTLELATFSKVVLDFSTP